MIAYGLRNPFRMIVRPGTNEVIVADVGWGTWEELNRIPDLSVARNFGWPCFEGNGTQYTGLDICPAQAQTTAPFLTYNHSLSLVPGDGCSTGSSSIAGMAFYQGASNYPPSYENALFFSDYSRKCMWVMFADGSGNPSPASTAAFANTVSSGPVDLQTGPDGNLYYVDFNGGRIMRIKYGLNAAASASPLSGDAPLLVAFDGSATAPALAGDTLTYAWDLDGDGEYDDSSEVSPSHTYTTPGNFTVRLQVTDQRGAADVSDPIAISAGNTAPTAVIDTPLASLTWKVNDTITFGGHGDDAQEEDGTVPESEPRVGGADPALPVGLPRAHVPDFFRRRRRQLSGARPRVPGASRHRAHGHRHAGPVAHDDREHPSSDRLAPVPDRAAGAPALRRHVHGHGALHPDRDPRLRQRSGRPRASGHVPERLGFRVLVRRRRRAAQRGRLGLRLVHRDVHHARGPFDLRVGCARARGGRGGPDLHARRRERRALAGDVDLGDAQPARRRDPSVRHGAGMGVLGKRSGHLHPGFPGGRVLHADLDRRHGAPGRRNDRRELVRVFGHRRRDDGQQLRRRPRPMSSPARISP